MANPIVLTAAGATVAPGRVLAIIWEGATTNGDTVELLHRGTSQRFWKGRTPDTQTYTGVSFAPTGIGAPTGLTVLQISAGEVQVFMSEG